LETCGDAPPTRRRSDTPGAFLLVRGYKLTNLGVICSDLGVEIETHTAYLTRPVTSCLRGSGEVSSDDVFQETSAWYRAVEGLGLRIYGLEFRVEGLGCRVWGAMCRVEVAGERV